MLLSREIKDVSVEYRDHSPFASPSNVLCEGKPALTRSDVEVMMDRNTQFSLDEKHGLKPKISILIPQLNSSRCISIPIEGDLKSSTKVSEEAGISQSSCLSKSPDPHEHYLSSEDDISNSDGNESLFDSDDCYSEIPIEAAKKTPQEITAKAVSIRIAGKPQIIEINLHSASSSKPSLGLDQLPRSPEEGESIHEKPVHPQLPAIVFTPTDLNFNNNYVFPPGNRIPETSESDQMTSSCNPQGDVKLHHQNTRSESFPLTQSTPDYSVVNSDLTSQGDHMTRSLLGVPIQTVNTPPAETSRFSSKFAALKRASKNIRNTSISRINLSYTPGVIQCRQSKQHTKSPHVRLKSESETSNRPFTR